MIECPNMRQEVLDAIHEHFTELNVVPEVEIDCLLYLASLEKYPYLVNQLSAEARAALNEMGRCERCGEKLEFAHYKEYHSEVDAYEDLTDVYCPNCDTPHQMTFEEMDV